MQDLLRRQVLKDHGFANHGAPPLFDQGVSLAAIGNQGGSGISGQGRSLHRGYQGNARTSGQPQFLTQLTLSREIKGVPALIK